MHRKIALTRNSILNIHLNGRVRENLEKVDPKLSNSQPQLKFADAYKKKRVCCYIDNIGKPVAKHVKSYLTNKINRAGI